jgi:hypothetical protein
VETICPRARRPDRPLLGTLSADAVPASPRHSLDDAESRMAQPRIRCGGTDESCSVSNGDLDAHAADLVYESSRAITRVWGTTVEIRSETTNALVTAVLLSLFLDARAGPEVPGLFGARGGTARQHEVSGPRCLAEVPRTFLTPPHRPFTGCAPAVHAEEISIRLSRKVLGTSYLRRHLVPGCQ